MPRYEYPGYGPSGDGWLTKRPGTKGGYHGGTDNPAKPNTPVYAEYSGKIFRSGVIAGYGRAVVVESVAPDGTKFRALYGHLGPGDLPEPGTPIAAGQPIPGAVIGTKDYVQSMGGLSTGPHLHREIISGNAHLKADGSFGIYSSEVDHKADPDTFDISHPFFPYEQQGQQLAPRSKSGNDVSKRAPGSDRIVISPPIAPSDSLLMPGMPIPGAEGPTSIGGPGGPQPVVPPRSSLPSTHSRGSRRNGGVLGPLDLGLEPLAAASLPLPWGAPPADLSPVQQQAARYFTAPFSPAGAEDGGQPIDGRATLSPVGSSGEMLSGAQPEQTYPVRRLISRIARQ
ncbi:M23 family metallopeptidase [Bradyrhizobium sp. SZCCHNS30592]|uniref:M23 family metallopeptidase n=1 Tax=unclassified Bradyrhizobium TaxID=2631580 RepID=UPI003967182C